MMLKKGYIFGSAIIKLVFAAACLTIPPADATGQQIEQQSISIIATRPAEQGELFSVSIDDAEIKDVLESLAYQAGLSLVLAEDVGGRISLRLKDVTWQTALDAVLQAGGYTVAEKNKVLSVSDSKDAIAIETYNLNFANAKEIEKTISKLVSPNGKVGIDERLNSIVVTDTAANLERIRQILGKLDVKARQVMIEVLIVNVKLTNELKMGVDWTSFGSTDTISKTSFSQGLSATGGSNPFGQLSFSKVTSDWTFTGLIDFVENNKDVRVLANPKVLVLNNHTAIIKTVKEIPYQQLNDSDRGGSFGTTAFKDAGVTLEVTPQITDDGYIIMHVKPEQSAQVDTFIIENSETPVIETRETDTTLRVKDGQTIIIGGLRERQPSIQESKVPILGDIPFIGFLFRKVNTKIIESELGVFITPHIYTDGKLTAEELRLLENNKKSPSIYEASDLLKLKSNN